MKNIIYLLLLCSLAGCAPSMFKKKIELPYTEEQFHKLVIFKLVKDYNEKNTSDSLNWYFINTEIENFSYCYPHQIFNDYKIYIPKNIKPISLNNATYNINNTLLVFQMSKDNTYDYKFSPIVITDEGDFFGYYTKRSHKAHIEYIYTGIIFLDEIIITLHSAIGEDCY